MITIRALIAGGILPTQARIFLDPIHSTCKRFGISNPMREAAFVGQMAYESIMFTHMEENLWYSTPSRIDEMFGNVHGIEEAKLLVGEPEKLANTAYANRNGNGDIASGDGWKYRGRGCFQLTGRNNYALASFDCGQPYLDSPDRVSKPYDACLTSGSYWDRNKLNSLADSQQFNDITEAINGSAMVGADKRLRLTNKFLRLFS